MRITSEIDCVVSGQLEVGTPGTSIDLRRLFPPRFEPKVIVNRRMLLPTRKHRGRSLR